LISLPACNLVHGHQINLRCSHNRSTSILLLMRRIISSLLVNMIAAINFIDCPYIDKSCLPFFIGFHHLCKSFFRDYCTVIRKYRTFHYVASLNLSLQSLQFFRHGESTNSVTSFRRPALKSAMHDANADLGKLRQGQISGFASRNSFDDSRS